MLTLELLKATPISIGRIARNMPTPISTGRIARNMQLKGKHLQNT